MPARVFVLHDSEWQDLKDGLETMLVQLQKQKQQLQKLRRGLSLLPLAKPNTE